MIERITQAAKDQGAELLESFKTLIGIDEDLKARDEYRNSFHTESFGSLLPYLGWNNEAELFILDTGDSNVKGKQKKSKVITDEEAYRKAPKGYLGFTLEANPQTGASDSMERILQSLYLQAPSGSSISIHLYASPDIMNPMKALSRRRYSDANLGIDKAEHEARNRNIYQVLSRRTIDYYLNGTGTSLFPEGNSFLLRNFRMIVSVVTPYDYRKETDIETTLLLRDQVKSTLAAAGFPSYQWKVNDLINFVGDFLDHSRVFHVPSKIWKEYSPAAEIRKQCTSREQEYNVTKDRIILSNSMDIEDTAIIQLSVSQFPKHFHLSENASLIGDFFQNSLAYPCPFMITTSAIVQDYDSMRGRATLKTATSVRKLEGYMAKLDPQIAEEAMEWKHALSSIEDGGTLIKMATNITLVTKLSLAAKAKSDVMAIWRSKGFRLADDRYQQLVSFLSSMPMTLTKPMTEDLDKMHRFSTKFSQNAVSLSPCIGEWKGTETPVMSFIGRRGQLVTLDLFDNNAGNYNFAIVGASGSGKTFVTQEILLSYRATGASVWVIDVGRGYENICKMIGGEFIEFTEEAGIIVNPFTHIQDIDDEMDMLKPLIGQMMSPDTELSAWEKSTLEQAISIVYEKLGNKMTMTDLSKHLLESSNEDADVDKRRHDMGVMLFPWTVKGAYGKYFEGEANITFKNPFTVLELEELNSKKHLQSVVLMIMMYRISQEMYLTRDQQKLCLIDEAWALMSDGNQATADFIATGYRRARKYNGSFGTATQSYADYKGSAQASLDNADWTFTLRQKEDSVDSMEQRNILNLASDPYKKRIIKDLRMETGRFSEIHIEYPGGSGVVRFVADPFKQILFSSKQSDFAKVQKYKSQGHDVVVAVDMAMRDLGISNSKPLQYGK